MVIRNSAWLNFMCAQICFWEPDSFFEDFQTYFRNGLHILFLHESITFEDYELAVATKKCDERAAKWYGQP